MRKWIVAILLAAVAGSAQAQTAGTFQSGKPLPSAQLNSFFGGKQDYPIPPSILPQVSVADPRFGAKCDGVTDDHNAFVSAMGALPAAGGIFMLPAATCAVSGGINVPSNVIVRGQGMDVSIVKQIGASGHGIFETLGTSVQNQNVSYQDFTCNVNSIDTCIKAQFITNFSVRRIHTQNVPAWGVWVGVVNGADTVTRNFNILVEDSVFDTQQSTFEAVLPFNARYVTIRRNRFTGGATAPGLGIYQNLDKVLIEGNEFTGLAFGSYFSQSTNNIKYSHNWFHDNATCLKGANQSDHGNFGFLTANNISIEYNDFFTCTNIAANLGAIDGGGLIGNRFSANVANTVVFDKGFNTGPGPAPSAAVANFTVSDNTFWNNNTSNAQFQNHSTVLFQNIGGNVNQTWTNNVFWDDQMVQTQLDQVAFSGAFTWSGMTIIGGSIPGLGGGTSFNLLNSAVATPVIVNVANLSGYPAGTQGIPARLRYCIAGVNFNSANTDNPLSLSPPPLTRYAIDSVRINNASASISTATVGVFTTTGGGGQTIAGAQAITVTATATDSNNNTMALTLTNGNTEAYNDATLQVRVGSAQGSPATADVCVYVIPLT